MTRTHTEPAPSPQQADVINHPAEPLLVVAGAGAGKTRTMAQRVAALVQRGVAAPEQVLGLTFTRKATENLRAKIRTYLVQLRDSGQLAPEQQRQLATINTTVLTYDSYAGSLVREYGLYLPEEPDSRIIGNAELYLRTWQIVNAYTGKLSATQSVSEVTRKVMRLLAEMESNVVSFDQLRQANDLLNRDVVAGFVGSNADTRSFTTAVTERGEYLDIVRLVYEDLANHHLTTFAHTMSVAAQLAQHHPEVGQRERAKYTVVMLDEYQDTSHSQRLLLSSLFGQDTAVTAVGDPMQTIYGWRGASSNNLAQFVHDFPGSRGQADTLELTTSYRNPTTILDLANTVATAVLGTGTDGKPRPVSPLNANELGGDVRIGLFDTEEKEADYVAATFKQLREADPEKFTAAILVRKHKHVPAMIAALEAAEVPYEVHFNGGLLYLEEVRALVDVARVLVYPNDSASTISLLLGPLVGIGLSDAEALARRAQRLQAKPEPVEDFAATLEAILAQTPEAAVSLGDALADLGPADQYSPEGYRRLTEFSATLRYLRTVSLRKGIADVFADIDTAFQVRTETLVRGDSTHLDRFHDLVAEFERIPNASLASFLDYLAAESEEDGLDRGEVAPAPGSVQILTVHAAKGLEFQHVAVVGAGRDDYPDDETQGLQTTSFLTRPELLPPELYGDAVAVPIDIDPEATAADLRFLDGTPLWEYGSVGAKAADFAKFVKAYKRLLRKKEVREATRLLYVALTRAEATLLVTAHSRVLNSKLEWSPVAPTAQLVAAKEKEEIQVVQWDDAPNLEESTPEAVCETALFPADYLGDRREAVHAAAELVRGAHHEADLDDTVNHDLDADVAALLAERAAQSALVIEVAAGDQLAATELVAIAKDPDEFARRKRRPVPYKPNQFAKRGTALHEWIERHYSQPTLLDDLELPGLGEETMSAQELADLQERFRASPWWDRVPVAVEQPFEIELNGRMIRGQIDAVFQTGPTSYEVVDWKSGQVPQGKDFEAASIQLSIYQIAWARLASQRTGDEVRPEDVAATFYYIRSGQAITPLHGEYGLA
ncbi:MAG: UvrD-helicase domain-containing protein [Corynebacterium sp.]|nr:UvrD-helicase domain-containing protein [Corynebacterium sp.]